MQRLHKKGPASELGFRVHNVHLIFVTAIQLKNVWAHLNNYVKQCKTMFKDCFLKQ